jgi:hypothetical protein
MFLCLITCISFFFAGLAFYIGESGLDDNGPYYPKTYDINKLKKLISIQQFKYKDGFFNVYNGNDKINPKLAYFDNNSKVQWAVELHADTMQIPERGSVNYLRSMKIRRIDKGLLRDTIIFDTLSHQTGHIYIWRWKKIHRFWFAPVG